jgi:hypothetical protein
MVNFIDTRELHPVKDVGSNDVYEYETIRFKIDPDKLQIDDVIDIQSVIPIVHAFVSYQLQK